MSKTLEEFIEKHVSEFSEGKGIATYAIKQTAAEILRVCEEWCNYEMDYDKGEDKHYQRGEKRKALDLYDFLKSYINPKPANTEGGE